MPMVQISSESVYGWTTQPSSLQISSIREVWSICSNSGVLEASQACRQQLAGGSWKGAEITRAPEYEDCVRAAEAHGVSVRAVYEAAVRAV